MLLRIGRATAIILLYSSFLHGQNPTPTSSAMSASAMQAAPADAETFMRDAEARLNDVGIKSSRASWVQETYITDDTEALSASANEEVLATTPNW